MPRLLETIDREFGQVVFQAPKTLISKFDEEVVAKQGFHSRADCLRRIIEVMVNGDCDFEYIISTRLRNGRRIP